MNTHAFFWLGFGCLVVVSLGLIWLYPSSQDSHNVDTLKSTAFAQESPINTSIAVEVLESLSDQEESLSKPDISIGSVEEACGIHEISSYDSRPFSKYKFTSESVEYLALEHPRCWTAMENHIHNLNPYVFLQSEANPAEPAHPLALIILDEPLTFERIFADPVGDLFLVQETLSRPECVLSPYEINWDLKGSCHAGALMNVALINRLCYQPYDPGRPETDVMNDYTMSELEDYEKDYETTIVNSRPRLSNRWKRWNYDGLEKAQRSRYLEPTREQLLSSWKHRLEDAWIFKKCGQLDPHLEFTPDRYSILYETAMSFESTSQRKDRFLRKLDVKNVREHLIELAARLGDEAAGLSRGGYLMNEDGYQFGRLAQSLSSSEWEVFAWKEAPSIASFLEKFKVLIKIQRRTEYQLNWKFVARHLCEPPQHLFRGSVIPLNYLVEKPRSCQSVITELRQLIPKATEQQQNVDSLSRIHAELHDIMDKFEQVAVD